MRIAVIVVGWLWILGLESFFPAETFASSLVGRVEQELRGWAGSVTAAPPASGAEARDRAIATVSGFYARRHFAPVWSDGQGLLPRAGLLLDALRDASAEGLCPEDYHAELISLLSQKAAAVPSPDRADPFLLAYLDLLLSDAWFRLVADHRYGRAVFFELREERPRPDENYPGILLEQALTRERFSATLAGLRPSQPGYRLLMEQLERYRQIAALGGWPKIPPGKTLHPGERDERVPLLRSRLSITEGETPVPEKNPQRLDEATTRALRRFQGRHGLSPDGVAGAETLRELNVTAEERVRQLELNLERWRWLPGNPGRRHLRVNIADFSLQLIEDERVVMAMAVIVGTEARKTPEFSGTMTYLELAPYWSVPPTILREDKLPLIRKNPDWLTQRHYEIVSWQDPAMVIDPAGIDWKGITERNFPGMLRQKPGPWNPLGQVKFMFPNRFSIYLHDTPDHDLFRRRVRMFSSGCIRIERPLDLAQYLLEAQGWDCDRLLAGMRRDTPLQVPLNRPVPVAILYRTAWVAGDGTLQFRKDCYLRDMDMETALEFGRGERGATFPVGSEEVLQPVEGEQGAGGSPKG